MIGYFYRGFQHSILKNALRQCRFKLSDPAFHCFKFKLIFNRLDMHNLGAVTGMSELLNPSLYSTVSTDAIFLTQTVDADTLFVLSDNLLFKGDGRK